MKNTFVFSTVLTIIAFFTLSFTTPTETETYTVDTEASEVTWKGYKVTGSHEGTIAVKNGSLEFTEGALTGGSFEMDMTSIVCTDLEGGTADKLVGHLASDDFFGVKTYPTSTFVITSVVSRGQAGDYKVIGDLTIKESTHSIKLQVQLTEGEEGEMTATTAATIDRSDYNVKYGSGSFFDGLGDKTIYDEFDLGIKLVTNKQK
ncbi:MAG: YceI family protein [Chitinophagales bacterium]